MRIGEIRAGYEGKKSQRARIPTLHEDRYRFPAMKTPTLRIAVMAHEFPALSETFVLAHITRLIDEGCDVTVFANGERDEPLEHEDVRRYDLIGRTCYRRMPENRISRVMVGLRLWIGLVMRRPPMAFRAINLVRYGRQTRSLELLYWTVRLCEIDNSRFDIIHCHFGPMGRLMARLKEIGAIRGPLITTFHGVDASAYLRADRNHYQHLFSTGALFLAVSRYARDRIVASGCDPSRTLVHHVGVDVNRFDFNARNAAPASEFRLLTVGRFVEKKGIEIALRAIALLVKLDKPVRYTIVGDGELRPQFERLIDELRIGHWVTLAGWQDNTNVRAKMLENDVLLAPSVTDQNGDEEGIPVTIMEAMATGLAVISTWHSGIPELLEHGESGLLVFERDPMALANAIIYLMDNPQHLAQLGLNGRAKVAAEFNHQVLNDRLLEIYRQLANNPTAEVGDLAPLPGRSGDGNAVVHIAAAQGARRTFAHPSRDVHVDSN